MSQIREDESKYKAVFGRKVSDNIFVMHFCQYCDAKCILLATGNWFGQFNCESCETCFQNNYFNLFMTDP